MLFIDYISAFNTIVRYKLVIKLETPGLDPAMCNWVLDFLTGRPQVVRVGKMGEGGGRREGEKIDMVSSVRCTSINTGILFGNGLLVEANNAFLNRLYRDCGAIDTLRS